MWGWLWSLKTKWQGWYWDRQDFQWLARQCVSLKEASGWNQSLAQCAQGRRKGVVWKESKRSSFALTHRFCSRCDPLPASTHQCDKLSTALPNLLTKNAFLYNDGKRPSMSQNQNFVDSIQFPYLHMRQLRPREGKELTQGHTADEGQSEL